MAIKVTYIDTNVFISALIEPIDERERQRAHDCMALFERIGSGQERAQTHDVIIAELAYFLTRSRQYRISPAAAVARIRPLVALAHLHLPNKRLVLNALDIWDAHPKLDFEDALTVAHAHDDDGAVISYDHDFDRVPGIARVEPA